MNANTQNTTDNTKRAAIEVAVAMRDEAVSVEICHTMLTLDFANGRTLTLDTAELPASVLSHAIAHGLKQKLVDAAAISRDPNTGRAASIDTKFEAVHEVFQRLYTGDWNKRREGGGNAGGLLFQALVRRYAGKKTDEQIKTWLDAKSDKEKAALRKNPEIAKIIDEIRAEKGDASASADLLAELDGE